MRVLPLVVLLGVAVSCSKDSSPAAPSPMPTPQVHSLSGTVSGAGQRLAGATVRIVDGPNANRQAMTDGSGIYRLTNLAVAGNTVSAAAPGYLEAQRGVTVNGATTLDFTLVTVTPWTRSGTGAAVFDMPTYFPRVRIEGRYSGRCENFVVRIASRLIVNVILGSCSVADAQNYDGTHLTSGGVVETLHSSGVAWTFTEGR